jgi:hypothetical protein
LDLLLCLLEAQAPVVVESYHNRFFKEKRLAAQRIVGVEAAKVFLDIFPSQFVSTGAGVAAAVAYQQHSDK